MVSDEKLLSQNVSKLLHIIRPHTKCLFSVFFSTEYRCSLVGITFALCLLVLLITATLIQQAAVSSSHLLLLLYRNVTYLLSKKDRLALVWLSSVQYVNVHF